MASNPKTRAAVNCDDCGLISVPASDPLRILERLPEALFNREGPAVGLPAMVTGDILTETRVFGPVPDREPTPQYELARILSAEKDLFVRAWRRAEALQRGLGLITVTDNRAIGEGHYAQSSDLDRVGLQFGIGRPSGFNDCCYWRLVQLMVFTPGNSTWLLSEIAELFTGLRPSVEELPCRINLTWPTYGTPDLDPGESFFNYEQYFNHNAFFAEDLGSVPIEQDSYWGTDDPEEHPSFWQSAGNIRASGLTLEQALAMVKPAGVFIQLINRPPSGASGCGGVTQRSHTAADPGRWAQGIEV